MKNIVVCILLGLISNQQVNASIVEHRHAHPLNHALVQSDSSSDSSSDSDDENVQLSDFIENGVEWYAAGDQGMTPNGVEYVRTIPEQYNDESPEKFMHNVLENYALEQKGSKGEPTGVFKMDKK